VARRARGYAPAPVLRSERFERPLLALGAELKSSIALAVGGAAYVSQHLGDLVDLESFAAFQETVHDLCAMYRVDPRTVRLAHDLHPAYPSSRYAALLGGEAVAVQHHAAHVASVLAERGAWDETVLGFAFDGAGLGDDGTVWGGELFHGSLASGLRRVGHLRPAFLPGGDAAARTPVQAAVGFLEALGEDALDRLTEPPFGFPAARVAVARRLVATGIRAPRTTSVGRLFDTVAALLGFHRTMSFEGQAAIGLEALARRAPAERALPVALRRPRLGPRAAALCGHGRRRGGRRARARRPPLPRGAGPGGAGRHPRARAAHGRSSAWSCRAACSRTACWSNGSPRAWTRRTSGTGATRWCRPTMEASRSASWRWPSPCREDESMCLGIPHEVVDVLDQDRCLIRLGGATQHCFIGLVDDLRVGDWVVVHAGFAIDKIAPEDARANLELIERYLEPVRD
jgi:hydrogenase assembly chaperone HypC/HupF